MASTLSKAVIFTVLLIPMLYQGIKFTLLYISQPTTTTTLSSSLPYEEFTHILVCTPNWVEIGQPLTKEGLAYLSGYSTSNELAIHADPTQPFRKIAHDAGVLREGRANYEATFKGKTAAAVTGNASRVTFLRALAGELSVARLPVQFHYSSARLVCGYVDTYQDAAPHGALIYSENVDGQLSDNPHFYFVTQKANVFSNQEENANYISLFSTDQFPYLRLAKHFASYAYEVEKIGSDVAPVPRSGQKSDQWDAPVGGSDAELNSSKLETLVSTDQKAVFFSSEASTKQPSTSDQKFQPKNFGTPKVRPYSAVKVAIAVDVNVRTYLHKRGSPCLNDTTGRYPAGFLERMCKIKCEGEAYNKIFGCSPFSFFQYEGVKSSEAGLPHCHIYDHELPGKAHAYSAVAANYNETLITEAKLDCMKQRECYALRHCREHEIVVRSVVISEEIAEFPQGTLDPETQILHSVSFLLPDKAVVFKEQLQIDLETWIGTTGGILGLYLGWSLITLFEMVSTGVKLCKERRGKSESQTSSVEPTMRA